MGLVACGTHQLPGLLAASQLSEARDAHGRPFAVLCHPHVRHLTVVLESEPDGASLADQRQVDQWVAHHGEWLAALSREPGLIACQISIESSPDPGTRLRHMLANRRSDHAPSYADEVMDEVRDTYPAGAAELKARIALTYRMNAAGGRKLSAGREGPRGRGAAPRPVRHPAQHGGGRSGPVDAQRLCEIVRAAYDPAAAETIENARAAGETAALQLGRHRARERAGAGALLPPRRGDLGHLGDGRRAAHRRRRDRPFESCSPRTATFPASA